MTAKCGLTVANNVNIINIENLDKCCGYWMLVGHEFRRYSKTGTHFDDYNALYFRRSTMTKTTVNGVK